VESPCEYGNEPSGSINCWEILEWQRNWRLLKKGSAPWNLLVVVVVVAVAVAVAVAAATEVVVVFFVVFFCLLLSNLRYYRYITWKFVVYTGHLVLLGSDIEGEAGGLTCGWDWGDEKSMCRIMVSSLPQIFT
jgi:hypothetical protein